MIVTLLAVSVDDTGTLKDPDMAQEKDFREGKLHRLLADRLDHIPGMVTDGEVNVHLLAGKVKRCRWTVYRWLHHDYCGRGGRDLIALSGGRISKEDMLPFLLP